MASHGCTMGCGNEYQFVIVNVTDSSTLFVCTACFVVLAMKTVEVMTEEMPAELNDALAEVQAMEQAPVMVMDGGSWEDDG